MERYRSGHNGADSKDSIPKVRTSANFSDCTRDPPGSNFQNFISFLRVVLLFSKTGYTLRYTEGYRSGHNGADSKSVLVKAHVGSNPTPSASEKPSHIKAFSPYDWAFFFTNLPLSDMIFRAKICFKARHAKAVDGSIGMVKPSEIFGGKIYRNQPHQRL